MKPLLPKPLPPFQLPALIKPEDKKKREKRKEETKHKPWETSHLPPNTHCAFVTYGGELFLEMDRDAINRAKQDVKNVVGDLIAAVKKFGENHPAIMAAAACVPAGVVQALVKNKAWLQLFHMQLRAAFPAAGSYLTAAGVIILIEIVIIVVRTIEIWQKDQHSVNGGVLIKIVFPNFQVLSQVYPRGGWKDTFMADL
jgi:hypothetical protein